MMRNTLGVTFMSLCLMAASNVHAGINAGSKDNMQLYFNGAPEANSGTPIPPIKAFTDWCGASCFPTTVFPVVNPVTGGKVGTARIWGKDMKTSVDGNTICFTEFMEYKLDQGIIYVLGRDSGTCGAYMDSNLAPPMMVPGAEELAGGGDGKIVGGTGKYSKISGTFNDRVYVEFMNRQTIVYYDALFINLMIDK